MIIAPSAPTPAPSATPAAPAAPAPAPATPQMPDPLAVFSYVRNTPTADKVDAPAYPFRLMSGASWVVPENTLYTGIGTDFDIAMKVARARATVGTSNQAQLILKDAKSGAFYVTGTAHPVQQKNPDGTVTTNAIPTFIDGTDFASVMKSVSVTKHNPDIQAVVGALGFIDLRSADSGTEQPFAPVATTA